MFEQLLHPKRSIQWALVVLITSCIFYACEEDDDSSDIDEDEELVEHFLEALGGEETLREINAVSWESTGMAFEFQQDPEPVQGLVADFDYEVIASSDIALWRQDWEINTDYAYESELVFTETVDGTEGSSEGANGFFSLNFGGFGVSPDPMYSTKLAARRKTLVMSSPVAIAQLVAAIDIHAVEVNNNMINTGFNTSSLGLGAATPDIQVEIDPDTGIPLRALTLENDPLLGDVVYEVAYATWIAVDELRVPTRLTHRLDGRIIRTEMLRNYTIDPDISTVNVTEAFPYNADEALAGYLSSQFHFRTLMQTFAIDFPPTITDANFEGSVPTATLANDPNTLRIAGDLQSHYTFAFNLGDRIVIYDTPVNDRRMTAVLARVRDQFGNAPISDVIISHDHFDHAGGLRAGLSEGGRLIVGSTAIAQEFTSFLARPSTVIPNPLADPTNVEILALEDSIVLGEGAQQVQFHVLPNSHTVEDNFILAYKPSINSVFMNDIHNPGFQFIFDTTTPDNQERLVLLAGELVDFIEGKNWEIDFVIGTHGFPDDNSVSYEALVALSNR